MKSNVKLLFLMLIVAVLVMVGCDDDDNGTGPGNSENLYAAITNHNGMRILDLEDLSNPVKMGHLPTITMNEVIVSGETAFVSSSYNTMQLMAIDISDLNNPETRGSADVADGDGRGMMLVDNNLYLCAMGLHLLDVSNIDQLSQITSFEMPIGGGRDVRMHDGYVYIPNGDRGLEVLGFEEDHFYAKGSYNEVNMFPYQISFVNDTHFLMTGYLAGLKYMNASDPEHPACLGTLNLSDETLNVYPEGVVVIGEYAYVTSNVFDDDNGVYTGLELDVIKINQGPDMELVNRIRYEVDTVNPTSTIYEMDGILAVVKGNDGVLFFNTEDPENPAEIGYYELQDPSCVAFFKR